MTPSFSNYRRNMALIWLVALLLIVLGWWRVTTLADDYRQREMAAANNDLANLTRLTQEHANRTFRAADQVIRFVQSRHLELGNKLDLSLMTQQGVIDAEIFPQVGIINEQGIYVMSNRPINGRLDLSDREHFQAHVGADTGELFVSKPVLGRATGKWSIQLTRRINRPNGQFGGVVVVSIAAEYFTKFYSELNLGDLGVVALYGLDGVARVRKVGAKEDFGANASNALMFEQIKQGQTEGSYISRSVVDNTERLHHYRKIPGYQLAVVAGYDTQHMVAQYRRGTEALWLQAAVVTGLILVLAMGMSRYLWQLRLAFHVRQQAQRQIEDRNEQLNAIFDLSPDGFVSFDAQHRVKYVNPAFKHMMDQGDCQLSGLDERDFSAWLAQRCKPHTPFSGILALQASVSGDKSDAREVIELAMVPPRVLQIGLRLSRSSSVSKILYLRDVTIETEVDHMKSEFLATAAHELRTPMASIFGFSELLLTETFDQASQTEFLGLIHSQSRLMSDILDELLDLARIEARRDKDFRYTLVNLQTLVSELVKSFPLPSGRDAPTVNLPDQPLEVMADHGKLRQALLNVLSNAYKYSPLGGPVQIQAHINSGNDQPSGVCIEVTDTGMGMTPEQTARVCERFYRADASGKIPGTGLGMSIVKEIVTLHRGRLSFVSTSGHGTKVQMWLPTHTTLPALITDASSNPQHPVASPPATS